MAAARSLFSTTMWFAMVMVLALLSVKAVDATTYSIQWASPPNFGALAVPYITRNAAVVVTIEVGDTLHFQYNNIETDLILVTDSAIRECDSSAPLLEWKDGDTSLTFTKTGIYFFTSSIPAHCLASQRVTVEVTATSSNELLATSSIKHPHHGIIHERKLLETVQYDCDGSPFSDCPPNESSPQSALQLSHLLVCLLLALGSIFFFQ